MIAIVQVAVLLATSTRYGYHRDELYFIVAGSHAAFGYPDQPPLVPLMSWATNALAPGSLLLLRTPSALAAGATTTLAALIARELGGGTRAQVIAAICTAVSGFALAVAHLVSTTTPDLLSTTVLGWLAVRATEQRSSERAVDSRFPSEANGSSARSRLPVLPPGGFARCFSPDPPIRWVGGRDVDRWAMMGGWGRW